MKNFEYKSLKEIKKMQLEELKNYYLSVLSYELNSGTYNPQDIASRRRIHFVTQLILKIDRLLSHRTLKIIKDERFESSKPRLYVVNRAGTFEIPSIVEAVREPVWLYEREKTNYTDIECYLFRRGIVSWYNPNDKEHDEMISTRSINVLNNGGNEIILEQIFPRNVSNKAGHAIIATKSTIVPTAIREYISGDKTSYYVNIGRNLELNGLQEKHIPDIMTIIADDIEKLSREIDEYYEEEHKNPQEKRMILKK